MWMADIMEHNLPVVLTDIVFIIKKTVINTMRNSHSICIRYFKKTIGLFLVLVLEFVVFLWNFSTLFLAILVILLYFTKKTDIISTKKKERS